MRTVEAKGDRGAASDIRVRSHFPETLLWRPQLITDDHGRARIDLPLADSITSWRLTASAVTADGRLGATQAAIPVFQPFFVDLNLPVTLTRGDEVTIPVVVSNYLDKPQKVKLTLEDAAWFERLDAAEKDLDLAAREVRSTGFRLRVRRVGNHRLQVTARGEGVADAVKRSIEVVPDGRRVERVWNGTLQRPAEVTLSVPRDAVEDSARAVLKVYPSSFSQLVEGLDAIFRMPYGCFEQTSSTTYPNVLALDYLRRTRKSAPQVEAKARQYIHLGYQRLLGFEVAGGGFDWFGRPPANVTLTAYGLMEFRDMARVHDVDPRLIERTRRWLLGQRKADGSWSPEAHGLEGDLGREAGDREMARLRTTAYVAWAVFAGAKGDAEGRATQAYLLRHQPETIDDPYVLPLVANALLVIDPDGREVRAYLDRLDSLKRVSEDGRHVWWEQPARGRTAFYGSGRGGRVETTALVVLALAHAKSHPETTRRALSWLVGQKDASGTWHSTQATVLALKALLAGTGTPLGGDRERRIELAWDDGTRSTVVIPADQAEVVKQIDFSGRLGPDPRRLTVTERSGTGAGYQVALRYHVPGSPREQAEPLAIELAYDRTRLRVNDTLKVTAKVTNRMQQAAPMVILDLPVPAGFEVVTEDLAGLVQSGKAARYQLSPRRAVVYLLGLEPAKAIGLRYRLRAVMPVKVAVPPARVYEYYDPDKQGHGNRASLVVD